MTYQVMRRSALELVARIHPAAALNFARRIAQTLHDSRSAMMMLGGSSSSSSSSSGYGSSGYYGAEDDHRPYPKPFTPVVQEDASFVPASDLPLGTPTTNSVASSGLGSGSTSSSSLGARASSKHPLSANKATNAMAAAVAAAAGGQVPPGLRGLHPSDVLPPERRADGRKSGPSEPRKPEPSEKRADPTSTTASAAATLSPPTSQLLQAPSQPKPQPSLWHENIQLKRSPSGPLRIGNLAVLPVRSRKSND